MNLRLQGVRIGLAGSLPPPVGGMANQTRQLAALLAQEGLQVDLVAVNAPYRPAWIGSLKGVRALFRLAPYLWALWRVTGRVRLLHVMANSGWSWHLFAAPAIWMAYLRGVPAVVNYRGGEAAAFLQRSGRWIKPTLRRAAALAVPSDFLQQVFSRYGVHACIVPNIIDLNRFQPAPQRPSGAPHPIVTRNLEPIYDIPTALRAFKEVRAVRPEARLTIAGSGPLESELRRLTTELGLTEAVTFTGRLDNDRIAALCRSADLALNPSMADNMPISILEALACGVPVISTRVGGVPFLVEHGCTALLVPPGDSRQMAQAALTLLDNRQQADALSQAGIALARRYAWPAVRERWFAVYNRLLYGDAMAQSDNPINDERG